MPTSAIRALAGSLALTALVCLAAPARADTIASGETKFESLSLAGVRTYDFSATAGDRLVVTVSEQSGGVQPEVLLQYDDPVNGLTVVASRTGPFTEQRLEHAAAATGSYRITVQESGANATGFFSLTLAKLPGTATSSADADGGTIAPGSTRTGTFDFQADMDVFTFSGTANDRIVVTVSDLGGTCQPEIYLYPPSGGALEASRTGTASQKKLDVRLAATGTYSIVLQDSGLNLEGTYSVAFVRVGGTSNSQADPDGGALASGATLTGTLTPRADTDVFTFQGTAGDRVLLVSADVSTATSTEIYLYPPDGTDAEATSLGALSSHDLEHVLQQSGTYTVVVHDNGLNSEGAYSLSLAKVPGGATSSSDADGGAVTSGATLGGTITPRADTDLFTFDGTAGDRVIVTTADFTTSTQTSVFLYPPGGGAAEASATGAFSSHKLEHVLLATGTYTILVRDEGTNGEGPYVLSFAKVPGTTTSASDADGGTVASGETRTGTLLGRADTDLFAFQADAGDRLILTTSDFTTATQSEMYLYGPGGTVLEASATGAVNAHRIEKRVLASGTYTVVVHDSGLNGEGNYAFSFAKVPASSGASADEDGGAIFPGETRAGRLLNRADSDVWRFRGEAGERVIVTTAELAGNVQPEMSLYFEGGDEAVATDLGGGTEHRIETVLPSSGVYSVVVSDFANDANDGYYGICLTKIPGPCSSPDDPDGGPIEFENPVNAQIGGQADLDAWVFYGNVGDLVTIDASRGTSGGGGVEPEIFLYPPGGGAAEASQSGAGTTKRLTWQLRRTGLYTIVVGDFQMNHDGTYDVTVGKSPPAPGAGVRGLFPPNGARLSDLEESLHWAPVAGATAYDVFWGEDPVVPLARIATGVTETSAPFPDGVEPDHTYYWQVVATTAGGTIPGPVTWFRTTHAPVTAADDFSDGDPTGDRNWFVVSGVWTVDSAKRFTSTAFVGTTAYDNRAVFQDVPFVVAGEFTTRVGLTSKAVRGANAELLFGYVDPYHTRFVRFSPGRVEIGQAGTFGGDEDGTSTKARSKLVKGTFDARVVMLSDGTVEVYLKRTKDAAFPAAPAATHRFQQAASGVLGYRAFMAKSTFDDFTATVRALAR